MNQNGWLYMWTAAGVCVYVCVSKRIEYSSVYMRLSPKESWLQ